MGGACNDILVRKSEGKRSLGSLMDGWENYKMDLKETGCDWIHLAWDKIQFMVLVNTVMNLGVT
jgi:hypothetical protein